MAVKKDPTTAETTARPKTLDEWIAGLETAERALEAQLHQTRGALNLARQLRKQNGSSA